MKSFRTDRLPVRPTESHSFKDRMPETYYRQRIQEQIDLSAQLMADIDELLSQCAIEEILRGRIIAFCEAQKRKTLNAENLLRRTDVFERE